MDNLTVIVLAAGGGTRMKSKTMKVLHPIAGRSMIGHVLRAVQAVEPTRVVAVVGHQREQVGPHITELLPTAVLAVQEKQEGTGHAVRIAMEAAGTTTGTVIVAAGGLKRVSMTVARSARTSTIRWPVTCSTRSHQCDPMSATAELGPPISGSRRQEKSVGSSSQSWR